MKIRNGFVSNSSSSSFIVHKGDEKTAEKFGLVLIPVRKLKERNRKLHKLKKAQYDIMKTLPDFLGYDSYYDPSDDILGIKYLQDEDYITEPYDRDEADANGVCEQFGAFRTDL